MATTIKLKNGSGAPLAGDLVQGEPALDLTNKRLYSEDSGGTVIEIGTTPTSLNTTGTVTFGSLSDGSITVTAFVDEDNMASDSASLVPTQQSVKAYVDSQIGGVSSSLSGLSDTTITSPADGALLFYDTGTSRWIDNVVSGDITIADTGVAAISSGVIVNADINASAAIDVSKTALAAGTGLTLTTNTLSVDAAQTQITSVGTLSSLSVSGTLTLGGTAVTATATELNYTDGVTSSIQTQLDSKVGANYTGDVNITGELLVDSYNETFKKVSSVSAVSGYQIASASYTQNFSLASQDTNPTAVFFISDGTKMFILGGANDSVFQYNLSTGFDLSTATYASVSFSVASQETAPEGLTFNTDGTKMFITGQSNAVYEYALSTGFDISTASYTRTFSVSAQESIATGIIFNPAGTKMFIVGRGGNEVNEYNLSTGYDISTASYSQVFSVSAQETGTTDIDFNADGTKMFIVGFAGDEVNEYALTTGFDVSTASYVRTFSVSSQDTQPQGLTFSANGTKMFITGVDGQDINEYSTSATLYSTTFDCENANVFETELDANTTVVFSNPPAAGTATDSTAYAMSLKVVQDSGASGYTVTWPTSVDWPNATAPTLTATASAVDQFVFYTYDGGTNWYGFTAGQALG